MDRDAWLASLAEETSFWDSIIRRTYPNPDWVDNFHRRVRGELTFPQQLRSALRPHDVTRVLDVGAGPHTWVGTSDVEGVEVVAVDPLAEEYASLLDQHGVKPALRTVRGEAERLADQFAPDSFHIIFSRNAVDHSYDPIRCFQQMLTVLAPGGLIHVEGAINEGVRQKYQGLHQWNFLPLAGDDVAVWNESGGNLLRSTLGEACASMAVGAEWPTWFQVRITKRQDR